MAARAAPPPLHPHSWLTIVGVFFLGIAVGVGSLLAWQGGRTLEGNAKNPKPELPAVVAAERPPANTLALAPMPHPPSESVSASVARPKPNPTPAITVVPRVLPAAVSFAPKVIVPLNQPDSAYTLPAPVNDGEHLVLRGRVRMLRVNGLGSGAVLDASITGQQHLCRGKLKGSLLRIRRDVVEVPAVAGPVLARSMRPEGVRFIIHHARQARFAHRRRLNRVHHRRTVDCAATWTDTSVTVMTRTDRSRSRRRGMAVGGAPAGTQVPGPPASVAVVSRPRRSGRSVDDCRSDPCLSGVSHVRHVFGKLKYRRAGRMGGHPSRVRVRGSARGSTPHRGRTQQADCQPQRAMER